MASISETMVKTPMILVFERYWDTVPKYVAKDLLPKLGEKGSTAFCLEVPTSWSSDRIIESNRGGVEEDSALFLEAEKLIKQRGLNLGKLEDLPFYKLAEYMRLYVSSKQYETVAEKIKGLAAAKLMKSILGDAKRLCFSIKGVDAESVEEVTSSVLSRRGDAARAAETDRIPTMVEQLVALWRQHESVLFLCGAAHANNLIGSLKEKGMEDNVVCCFVHSSKPYYNIQGNDEISLWISPELYRYTTNVLKEGLTTPVLKQHTYCLSTTKQVEDFSAFFMNQVESKTQIYRKETGRNSHQTLLRERVHPGFTTVVRGEDRVDAVLEVDAEAERVPERLQEANVVFYRLSLQGRAYLIVPDVNTRPIAKRLRAL